MQENTASELKKIKNLIAGYEDQLSEVKLQHVLKSAARALKKSSIPEAMTDPLFFKIAASIARALKNGIPIAYLEGEVEFYNLKIKVLPGVFIPRPDTEFLVEFALEKIKQDFYGRKKLRILDVGTGTGAIALALAYNLKEAEVVAIDKDPRALRNALFNREKLNLKNVEIFCVDFKEFLPANSKEKFDVIVSNPPYIGEFERYFLPKEVIGFEPEEALFAGKTGLEFYELLFSKLHQLLKAGGYFFFETGFWQGAEIVKLAHKKGFKITVEKDYSGHDRIVWGRFKWSKSLII